MFEAIFSQAPVLAQMALTWTPMTYYILSAVVQVIVILVGFRVLHVDPETNSFVGAIFAAAAISAAGLFLRDAGVIGVIIVGGLTFAALAGITSGAILQSFILTAFVLASWGGLGKVVLPRTPLDLDDVGGFTRVFLTGGLEAEPITDTDSLDDVFETETDEEYFE